MTLEAIQSCKLLLQVTALCAVVASAVALTKIQGLNTIQQVIVDAAGGHLLPVGRAGSGLVLAAAAVGLILEVLFITLRFLNVGIINYKIRIVLFVVCLCVIMNNSHDFLLFLRLCT